MFFVRANSRDVLWGQMGMTDVKIVVTDIGSAAPDKAQRWTLNCIF